ncbi:MAG: cation-translocating P-type ATPase [Nitrososphaerales archaeon]|nr:cation-translocating P-type ATPase [Nitrososphaerales archaeon]
MEEEEEHEQSRFRIRLAVISGILLATGLITFLTDVPAEFRQGSFGVSLALVAGPVLYDALKRVRENPFNEDLLMGTVGIGAAGIGAWGEGAAVLLLYNIAERVEDYTVDRVRNIAKRVAGLLPKRALIKRNGRTEEIPIEDLSIGDIIVVKAGWRIPVDGRIVAGRSNLDQSIITGESIPVEKSLGDRVLSGSLSVDGSLEVLVEKPYKESTVNRIVEMVTEAHERKAKIERFIDRFSRYYIPSMILLSAGIALIPPLVLHQPFQTWLYRALIVLVIACPSALVISTPVTVLMGLTRAMWSGILIKGGRYLEELSSVKTIIFDKTGTLTQGKLRVSRVVPLNGFSEEEVLRLAAMAESRSSHPIAHAILEKASYGVTEGSNGVQMVDVAGKGIKAILSGRGTLLIGKTSFLMESGVEISEVTPKLMPSSGTTMAVALDGRMIGAIYVEDEIRPEAKDVVTQLHSMGKKTIMMTGDNAITAQEASTALGIDEYYAELLPEDKVRLAGQLKKNYGNTLMVGDGVNDAPALAASNVGIAVGTAGNDIAIEAADVALMGSDLKAVPYLLKLGRKASTRIKFNIALALAVKALMIVLGAAGLIPLWFAVIGDDGLTLLIIANALPLLRFRPRPS